MSTELAFDDPHYILKAGDAARMQPLSDEVEFSKALNKLLIGSSWKFDRDDTKYNPATVDFLSQSSAKLLALGEFDLAVELCEKAVEIALGQFGESLETARSLALLGHALRKKDSLLDASDATEQELNILKSLHKREHPAIADCLSRIATIEYERQRIGKASQYWRRELEMLRLLHRGNHIDIAGCLYNIGVCEARNGYHSEAEIIFSECLAMQKKLYKHNDFQIVRTHFCLAAALFNVEKYDEADDHTERAIALCIKYKKDLPKGISYLQPLIKLHKDKGNNRGVEHLNHLAKKMQTLVDKNA